MTTIAHAATATVHTLAGMVETCHASAFEPEQFVTVYGLTEGGAVRSAKVEAGALTRRELGGARRAMGCDTVYFRAGGVWVAAPASGAEELGPLCVPAAILARAALTAVVEVLPPGPEAEAFSAWVAAGCPVPAVTYRLGGLEAYNRGAALVRAPDAASYAAGAAYQRWAEASERAADAAWAATWQALEADFAAALEVDGQNYLTPPERWRGAVESSLMQAAEHVADALAARAELGA